MIERAEGSSLGGASDAGPPVVEVDDVYLGGERNEGSGTEGKSCVIVACERHKDGRMGHVAMRVVGAFSSEAVAAFRDAHIASGATVRTDGLRAFNAFGAAGRTHVAIVNGGGRPERERSAPFFTVNTLVANLSTALKATHKRLSPKHLPDCLGAFCWTTNRRRNMRGTVSAFCRAVATSSRLIRRDVYA